MKGRCPEIERRCWLGAAPGDAELNELLVLQRQAADGFAGRGLDCVENGGRDDADGGFADAAPEVVGRDEDGFHFWHFGELEHCVVVEVRLGDAAVVDGDFAVEGGGEAVDDGAFYLGGDLLRVYGVAAVEGEDHAGDFYFAVLGHGDFGGGGGVAAVSPGLRRAGGHARGGGGSPVAVFPRRRGGGGGRRRGF